MRIEVNRARKNSSDKEKYLKLKEKLEEEKINKDEKENLIFDYEDIIIKQETIIKLLEVILIPLFLTTFGIVLTTFKIKLLNGFIVYMIISVIELVIVAFIYYRVLKKKHYTEKILNLIKKN